MAYPVAVAVLMSAWSKTGTTGKSKTLRKIPTFNGRNGLGAYTFAPANFPPSRVIFYNDEFVAINDLFPKSSVHTLLLWRNSNNTAHPFDAFEDEDFLTRIRSEANRLQGLVAEELRRKFGNESATEQAREKALNGEVDVPEGEDLPPGRDWEKEVLVGVHAHPSMNHLHVHVLSRELFSERLKRRNHYNSFTTGYFVPLKDFPLPDDDIRRDPDRHGFIDQELECWRCGATFGSSMARMKVHLAEEFEKWKKE